MRDAKIKKSIVFIAAAAAAVILFLQLFAAPRGWAPTLFGWPPDRWAVLLGCAVAAVLLILCRLCRTPSAPLDHMRLASVAVLSILCGAAILLTTVYDAGRWLFTIDWSAPSPLLTGKTPSPNATIISGIDGLLLFLTWIFGVLGGIFLMRLGFSWLVADISVHGRFRKWALAPVLWSWTRLARYTVSYASAVNLRRNLDDFMMLIFTLLFFFYFARYTAAVGKPKKQKPTLLFVSACAFLFSFTASAFRLLSYWSASEVVTVSTMASAADMAVGLTAFGVAIGVAFTDRTETVFDRARIKDPKLLPKGLVPPKEEEKKEPEPESPSPLVEPIEPVESPTVTEMDVDRILEEIYRNRDNKGGDA